MNIFYKAKRMSRAALGLLVAVSMMLGSISPVLALSSDPEPDTKYTEESAAVLEEKQGPEEDADIDPDPSEGTEEAEC